MWARKKINKKNLICTHVISSLMPDMLSLSGVLHASQIQCQGQKKTKNGGQRRFSREEKPTQLSRGKFLQLAAAGKRTNSRGPSSSSATSGFSTARVSRSGWQATRPATQRLRATPKPCFTWRPKWARHLFIDEIKWHCKHRLKSIPEKLFVRQGTEQSVQQASRNACSLLLLTTPWVS